MKAVCTGGARGLWRGQYGGGATNGAADLEGGFGREGREGCAGGRWGGTRSGLERVGVGRPSLENTGGEGRRQLGLERVGGGNAEPEKSQRRRNMVARLEQNFSWTSSCDRWRHL